MSIEQHNVMYERPEPCGESVMDIIRKAKGLISEGVSDQAVANGVVHELIKVVGMLEAKMAIVHQRTESTLSHSERFSSVEARLWAIENHLGLADS